MDVQLFDFALPDRLIAQSPLPDRTSSRLLVLNKDSGSVEHRAFSDIIDYLHPGDALVINNTKVIPARLFGIRLETGAKVEVLLLKNKGNDRWETLIKPAKRAKQGTVLVFGADETDGEPLLTATVIGEGDMGQRELEFSYKGIFNELLDRLGQMPLPPYIKERLSDRDRYQTVYAKVEGSAAAPTAGLHFNESILSEVASRGIAIAPITLHVGLGTFRPVSVEKIEEHEMHAEYYSITAETAHILNKTRERGGRIVSVGTTSARTLETVAQRTEGREIQVQSGWTDIFIYPGYTFQMVDALLTNFHLPKSTLVMLVSAFAGREATLAAYKEAIEQDYRFFSFGDAMFIY